MRTTARRTVGRLGTLAPVRVLICDDSRFVLAALSHQLSGEGWRVSVAAGGREAVDLAEDEAFDLVLLDVHMPDLDGPQTRRRLALLPGGGPTVIYLTGSPEEAPPDAAGAVGKSDAARIAADVRAILDRAPHGNGDGSGHGDDAHDPLAALAAAARVNLGDAARDLASCTGGGDTGPRALDIAHRIAGSAGMFGAPEASAAAAELEDGLRRGRLSPAEAHAAARRIERLLD